jgi:hypothetical protein
MKRRAIVVTPLRYDALKTVLGLGDHAMALHGFLKSETASGERLLVERIVTVKPPSPGRRPSEETEAWPAELEAA